MKSNQRLENLFRKYLNDECNPEEIRILLQYFGKTENEALLKNLIRHELEETESQPGSAHDSLLANTFENIKNAIASQNKQTHKPVLRLYLRPWFRISAAASVIFFLSATAYFLIPQREVVSVTQHKNQVQPTNTDIAPGKNNAILTLDNGKTIVLDSAANGILAKQGSTKVQKIKGQIVYHKSDIAMNTKTVYNTITTANSNQYQLILTDGSKVWLNAASSIRFPTSFTGNERRVEITGEAYFEVTKNAAKPFRVDFKNKAGEKDEIEVLGTHFNVNTYADEPDMKTTLLEGSVKITTVNKIQMLTPGQQARLTPEGIELKKNVDIEQVMAWKNGYFLFDNTDIYTLMRQVSRWYNVDVKYEGKITEEGFSGKISRDVPLSKFIKVLELNDVHVRTEGRRIVLGFEND